MTSPGPAAGGPPAWLPATIQSSGDWIAYIEQLWQLYLDDFVRERTFWRGKTVFVDKDPQSGGKDFSFWHIISGIDPVTKGLKEPEPERCARLCWVRPMLEAPEEDVRSWVQETNGFIAIALPDFSYAVILKELRQVVFLKSGYYVRPARREQMRKQYERARKR